MSNELKKCCATCQSGLRVHAAGFVFTDKVVCNDTLKPMKWDDKCRHWVRRVEQASIKRMERKASIMLEEWKALASQAALFHEALMRNGLIKTAHKMHEVVQQIGFEMAELIEKEEKEDENGIPGR